MRSIAPAFIPRSRVLFVLVSLFGFATTMVGGEVAWSKVTTDDFVAYSDASQNDVAEFLVQYTAYRQVFRKMFGAPDHRLPPATLMLFRRTADFQDHGPRRDSTTELRSFSVGVDGRVLLSLSVGGDRAEALRLAIEFETTWGLRRCGYYVPLWMSQGTGKVLSTLQVRNGKVRVGRATEGIDYWFYDRSEELPWPHFFAVTADSPDYKGATQAAGTYHSQAWALMHWVLLDDAAGAARFAGLAARLRTQLGQEAIESVMNTDVRKFSEAIRRHLKGSRKVQEFDFDEAGARSRLKFASAPPAEVAVLKAELLAASGRSESAQQLLYARQVEPDLPVVKEAWARKATRENNPDEATRLYREAIECGSTNYMAYLNSASARLDDSAAGGADYAGGGGRGTTKAIEEIKTAMTISSGDRWTYQLLGRAYYVSPTITEENVKELDAGVTLGEDGEAVRYYRGLLWLRLDRVDEFKADLEQVIADPETTTWFRTAAKRHLAYQAYSSGEKRVQDALTEGKVEEAQKILVALDALDLDRNTAQRYRHLRATVESAAKKK
ncbi:MAG TPA: hypothetical protein VFJ90_16705 [Candidatus Didemnitutus sp.]|nr:hypothetical protein [Candidatus Didemnitutus sp.]